MMYEHKKGATLSLAGAITATAGETLPDFSGTRVTIRTPDNLPLSTYQHKVCRGLWAVV